MLATIDGFITDAVITSANIDDRAAVWDLTSNYCNITMIGDKDYMGNDFAADLKTERNINMLPLKKSNSKIQFPKELRQTIFRLRRRIETTASQLTCQLNIERVLAKSYGVGNKD